MPFHLIVSRRWHLWIEHLIVQYVYNDNRISVGVHEKLPTGDSISCKGDSDKANRKGEELDWSG
jgi:hypothetical protein